MKNNTRKVVVSTRSVYHKYAEVVVDVPLDVSDKDVDEWLANNDNFSEELDEKLGNAKFEYGFGLGDGMEDINETSETRFDVYDINGNIKYGGHC